MTHVNNVDVKKFRKLPVIVEASQWFRPGDHPAVKKDYYFGKVHYYVETLEGDMRVERGDWIIKGVNGEYYPCKQDIFAKTYEEVVGD